MEDEIEDEHNGATMTRRSFALGTCGAVALIAMGGLKAIPAKAKVRPPGGQDEDRLIAECVRCQRCVEECPRHALQPALLEDGILGVRMPTSNFNSGWCDFCKDENNSTPRCVEVCPTDALSLLAGATAEETIIGKAVIIKDWCLAWSKENGCKFCYDACPYEAITMNEYHHPVVDLDKCNGCGACQCACVSLEEGSISIGATSRAIVVVPEEEAREEQ